MKKPILKFALSSIICSVALGQNPNPPPLPNSMLSLGDSITAGALAAYSLTDYAHPRVIINLLKDLFQFAYFRKLASFEKKYLNWSTGLDPHRRINSHAFKLKTLNPNLTAFNLAVSGASSKDVETEQLPQLQKLSLSTFGTRVPDYTTILVGANDVCAASNDQMTSLKEFEGRVTNIFSHILNLGTENRVLVSEIPALDKLPRFKDTSLFSFINPLKTCGDYWKKTKLCKNVLSDDPESRLQVSERIHSYNQILAEVVESLRNSYGDRIRFAGNIYSEEISKEQLALDCFHPNIGGQQSISKVTWQSSWWSDEWNPSFDSFYSTQKLSVNPEWDEYNE